MNSEWTEFLLKDVATVITGKTPPGTLEKYFGGETLFVTPTDMEETKFIRSTSRTLSEEGKAKQSKLIFDRGIVVSCIGWQMGKSAIVNQTASTNQQINTVLPNEELVDFDFLYYVLKAKREVIFNLGSTATRTPILKKSLFEKIAFRAPSLDVQKVISRYLSSLDRKIDLNRQTNQTLEQIAQAIFKSWFVDFDPVRAKIAAREAFIQQHPEVTAEAIRAAAGTEGDTLAHTAAKACELAAMTAISGKSEEQLNELDADTLQQLKAAAALFPDDLMESEFGEVPEGWRVKSLDEIAVFLNGLALQKFPPAENEEYLPVIKIAEMRSGVTDKSGRASKNIDPNYVVKNGDVLFSWSGSLLVMQWHFGEGALNQHLFKVTSDIYPKWFYYFATLRYLPWFQEIAASKATTMGHIQRKHLSDAKVEVCNSELLELGDKVIAPLLDKSLELMLEIKTLEELRDNLLPKLLSGELNAKVA